MCVFFVPLAELSNLLVIRQGASSSIKPVSETLNLSQLRFHQIKDKEITRVSFSFYILPTHLSCCIH